ncbi:DUF6634 family protein [Rhizobium sp. WYJ-E13]|uniref:DUF6634 family protein n=1 Tax=Rhizobium sp. WYJ-E13 TaxID=2849093 RepID=UPI001C1EE4BC|nr:DUF6634 family protein [Rhizobium sp. WYJ-E13]QWW70523.1 hypothetical protein KQ933_27300 [Rhizobium sp. WYJ-E13]
MNTFQWIDSQTTERLLEDLRRANAGQIEIGVIANAPLLDSYRAVLGRAYALKGIVTGHPRLEDGKEIITSQLFYLDPERGVARTMNNWYRLSQRDQSRGN